METVTWTTLEFEQQDRHPDWNWYVGLVTIILATAAFFYGDIFFGIFLIIAGITVVIYALRPPKTLVVVINADGVSINQESIPYATIKQFWLDETDKQDKLLLLVKGSFVPMLALPLQNITAEIVRTALKDHISEVKMQESRSIKFFESLGF
jgi:hypothetical protein